MIWPLKHEENCKQGYNEEHSHPSAVPEMGCVYVRRKTWDLNSLSGTGMEVKVEGRTFQ